MLCRQRHQPVDDEEQRSEVFPGIAPGVELLGEFQPAFGQVCGILAVLLGAEVGGDDEDRQVVAVAGVFNAVLEVVDLADGEANVQSQIAEATRVAGRPPVTTGIAEDDQGHDRHLVPAVDAAAVVEDSSGQFGVILHLHLDMDEQPLFGAIEQPNLDQLVGSQGPQLGVGRDLPEFLVQRNRCDRPIDVPGDRREGELQEGAKEAVEGFFPGALYYAL